jgi:succinyl-diaminopimelate desuccinylase
MTAMQLLYGDWVDLSALAPLLTSLVRIPSVSGSTSEALGLQAVADWFADCPESAAHVQEDEAGNAVSVTVLPQQRSQAPLLLFSAHIDVVPVGDPGNWARDPFSGELDAGRIYGRGSSDMKSGLAAAMVAVRRLHIDGVGAALAVSTREEVGCLGAPAVVTALAGVSIGAVIIPESTSNEVVLGHRGALWLRISTKGKAAHGSTPHRGENAIVKMTRLLSRIDKLPRGTHPHLGVESVNIGRIEGGSATNIVPDSCTILLDHRLSVSTNDDVISWWKSMPEVHAVHVDLSLDAVWTSESDSFVQLLPAPLADGPASFYTDASVLVRSLQPGTPFVIWGPGDPGVVHSMDEWVDLDAVSACAEWFYDTGARWADSVESDK